LQKSRQDQDTTYRLCCLQFILKRATCGFNLITNPIKSSLIDAYKEQLKVHLWRSLLTKAGEPITSYRHEKYWLESLREGSIVKVRLYGY
jgi:hypothetical protein